MHMHMHMHMHVTCACCIAPSTTLTLTLTLTRTLTRTASQAFVKRYGSTSMIPEGEGDAALVTSLKVTEAEAQDLVVGIEHPYRRRVRLYVQCIDTHPTHSHCSTHTLIARAGGRAAAAACDGAGCACGLAGEECCGVLPRWGACRTSRTSRRG